jgi:hypothetical protein
MTESLKNVMVDSYRARIENQVNGMKDSPFVAMCLQSFRHGIENTLDEVNPKIEKLKKLADAMYDAAQYMTTDASRLRNAMREYHQFVIQEYYD